MLLYFEIEPFQVLITPGHSKIMLSLQFMTPILNVASKENGRTVNMVCSNQSGMTSFVIQQES